jgi:hypothetical protein
MGDAVRQYEVLYAVTLRLGIEYFDLPNDSGDNIIPSKTNDYGKAILATCSDGTVLDASGNPITGKCWMLQDHSNTILSSLTSALNELDDVNSISVWAVKQIAQLKSLFKLFGFEYNTYSLNNPKGVAVDSANNVYISDTEHNRILKITQGGIMTTYAGTGYADYGGDGGAATGAFLNKPRGIAFDSSNNMYIADCANNRIRKVTYTTGIITTVAGTGTGGYNGEGTATAKPIYFPRDVALDSAGNLYIADTSNNRIRKVTSGGTISTIAGTGTGGYNSEGTATSCQINYPEGICFDSNNNLYIADTGNNRIRMVVLTSGLISTIAGNGTAGYDPTYNPETTNATTTTLNNPKGVVDSGDGILVADSVNNMIRLVRLVGGVYKIYRVAGTGTAGFTDSGGNLLTATMNNPNKIAIKSNNVYIADTNNNHIREIVNYGTTPVMTTFA